MSVGQAPEGSLSVTVVASIGPRQVVEVVLQLPQGARIADALLACGKLDDFYNIDLAAMTCGVWGRKAEPQQLLQDGDRLEFYRPLKVDPKTARRERFARQGARSAGLFAKRRAGGKPGY
jgi:sulfur carrier protein